MYIIDLTSKMEEDHGDGLSTNIDNLVDICSKVYQKMDLTESLWVFLPPRIEEASESCFSLEVANRIKESCGCLLRDIVSFHTLTRYDNLLKGVYEDILLFVKDSGDYKFYKDSIRVDPVYEGKEWNGLRENGKSSYRGRSTKRYNSEGKDPGNVWISEIRNETNNSVLDRTEPFPRIEAFRRCVRAGSNEGEIVSTLWTPDAVADVIAAESRQNTQLDSLIAQGES